ncbi:MAG: 2'-5' RNA ligase family protein [Acutalibacteraceae bacterium]|nr:2'-5' RNA ligase family protein [Acutalibacteraceae bacterium]
MGLEKVYAIEMYFDKETEDKIMSLAQKIADNKLSTKFLEWKTRPHVTLAVFNEVDENKCIELLKEFTKERKVLPAFLDSVGMFNDTKTIFLNPTMTKNMYQLQSDLYDTMKEFDTQGWEWYLPDGWVPHCTIALNREDEEEAFYKSSELVLREFKKIEGKYTALGLVKLTFPVKEIATIPFSV